jgi:excinuclease ABC subunit C
MQQVLRRRFRRELETLTSTPEGEARAAGVAEEQGAAVKLETADARPLPDILLIDGGPGQVAQARGVLQEYQLHDIFLLGIAKGEGRKAEFDHLVLPNKTLSLPKDSAALHLLQELRDEAHRFAITGHRKQRATARKSSTLEDISGIGAKRRQAVLAHFGGLQGVQRAGVEDLASVPGISRDLAQKIYDAFHD